MNTPEPLAARIRAIAIGTSAGGVEALCTLLPALPRDLRASVFIVIHLPRGRPSLLVDILQPRCQRPVREPLDKEPIEPGSVYVAPPDYHLLIDQGDQGPQVALSIDPPVHHSRPSVDVLFESAADQYGAHLLGIVLTGANQDGADGLERIHHAGGITVVQRPEEAQAWLMPASALQRGPVDQVLSLNAIADLLRTLKP